MLDLEAYQTIKLSKEYLKFSAAHFTIFSETKRERLHGHNFNVDASVNIQNTTKHFLDYGILKKKLKKTCDQLDEYTLLPQHSPHLQIKPLKDTYQVTFAKEIIPFLKSDCLLLPIQNTTVEALSSYMLQQYLTALKQYLRHIQSIDLGVSSGPGQIGYSHWVNPKFKKENIS